MSQEHDFAEQRDALAISLQFSVPGTEEAARVRVALRRLIERAAEHGIDLSPEVGGGAPSEPETAPPGPPAPRPQPVQSRPPRPERPRPHPSAEAGWQPMGTRPAADVLGLRGR